MIRTLVAAYVLAGCASAGPPANPKYPPAAAPKAWTGACDAERDRAAVRAMAGEFKVSFAFEETQALTPGYTPKQPYRVGGEEVVELLEETPNKLVLQHVLLLEHGGKVTAMKHWRQDWLFESADLLEFRGHAEWQHRTLPKEAARCSWSQAVYEVNDGPRYASYGHWVHTGTESAWTSQTTYRPLPRREYTHRSDYDLLVGTNRHVITEGGWSHEQDNVKWVLADGRALVRERGLNRYQRTTLAQAGVARTYLAETKAFWAGVRGAWQTAMESAPAITLLPEVDGKGMTEWLFPLAETARRDHSGVPVNEAKTLVRRFVQPAREKSVAQH